MKNDFRALCAELAEQLDDSLDFTVSGETRRHMKLLIRRARAALADEPTVPLPLADAVATVESECLHFLTTETGRSLTPDLIESLYGQFRGIIAGLVDAPAQPEPVVVWSPWRLRYCPTHGQQPANAWACPECVRELRQQLSAATRVALADEPAVPDGREPAAVTGQPSDEEVERRFQAWWHDEGSGMPPCADEDQEEHVKRISLIAWQNGAYCARWGNRQGSLDSTPPADGEVAELVAWLQEEADDYECIGCEDSAARCNRAAELLERQVLVPVPVSERPWEREGWCNAEGRCWWGRGESDDWFDDWTLATFQAVAESYQFSQHTHCLPAHALPLPEVGE